MRRGTATHAGSDGIARGAINTTGLQNRPSPLMSRSCGHNQICNGCAEQATTATRSVTMPVLAHFPQETRRTSTAVGYAGWVNSDMGHAECLKTEHHMRPRQTLLAPPTRPVIHVLPRRSLLHKLLPSKLLHN